MAIRPHIAANVLGRFKKLGIDIPGTLVDRTDVIDGSGKTCSLREL
jgi:hypothetical protein